MITCRQFEAVKQLNMARHINGRALYTMACYYVDGLLVDSGPVHVASEALPVFKQLPIKVLVNTHHHEDHIGNNFKLQKDLGLAPALAHPLAVPIIRNPEELNRTMTEYRRYVWGEPEPSEAEPIGEEIILPKARYQVIHTPGHSPDHICLLQPDAKWLLAGDLFISTHVKQLRADEDVNTAIASLRRLVDYDFSVLFCASGAIVENARQAVRDKIAFWEELREKVIDLAGKGWDEKEITSELLGEEGFMYQATEGDFGKINLVRSFLKGR